MQLAVAMYPSAPICRWILGQGDLKISQLWSLNLAKLQENKPQGLPEQDTSESSEFADFCDIVISLGSNSSLAVLSRVPCAGPS